MRDPRRAYHVVDQFEEELEDYCDAPYAVTVDSCTNALHLALVYEAKRDPLLLHQPLEVPRHTYVGVLQAARNAGYTVRWTDEQWDGDDILEGSYRLWPTHVVDSARRIPWRKGNSYCWSGNLMCLSFHAAKQLPLGRGGAILTDDPAAADWLRAARMDGRPPGAAIEATQFPGFHCPMPPDTAARGLWILSRWNDAGYTPPPLPPEVYPDLSVL